MARRLARYAPTPEEARFRRGYPLEGDRVVHQLTGERGVLLRIGPGLENANVVVQWDSGSRGTGYLKHMDFVPVESFRGQRYPDEDDG